MISKRLLAGGALVLLGLMLGTLMEGFGPLGWPKQAVISALEITPSASASPAIDEAALNGDVSPPPAPAPEPTATVLPTPNPPPARVVSLLPSHRTSPTPRPKPKPTPSPTPSPTPVDLPPLASLGVYPSTGLAPLTINADASGSTDSDATPIISYQFDFGDGTPVVTRGTSVAGHIYGTPGSYTVKVTVTDSAGLSGEASAPVRVDPDQAPNAALSVDPASGAAPLTVTADSSGSSDGDMTPIATYQFDFGDGTVVAPAQGSTASHTYATAGSYTITVTVVDTAGLSSTAAATVTVS